MQWRRKDSTKEIKKYTKVKADSKFMVLACVSYNGKAILHVHAKRHRKKRGNGNIWHHESVNTSTFLKAIKESIIPFCASENISLLISDGVQTGRSTAIKNELNDNSINLYPSAKESINGYPPNSHDCNPLETIFARWKERIYMRLQPNGKTTRTMDNLYKVMNEEWNNIPQSEIQAIINLQPKVMQEIIDKNGDGTKY